MGAASATSTNLLPRLLTAGGYVGAFYVGAICFAVLMGCVADTQRRQDAHRVLALLLFRRLDPPDKEKPDDEEKPQKELAAKAAEPSQAKPNSTPRQRQRQRQRDGQNQQPAPQTESESPAMKSSRSNGRREAQSKAVP